MMLWNTSIQVASLSIIISLTIQSCQESSDLRRIENPPNVILIFMDDMGYGDLGCFGHPTIETPNIDRLANLGQRWTNFYTACSVCSPSRAALLTGRYPIRSGLAPSATGDRVFFPHSKGGIPSSEVTIAEMLKDKGYNTAIIGKWHLGHLPEFLPTRHGFDYYYGIPYSNDMDRIGEWNFDIFMPQPDFNTWDVPLMENENVVERPANQNTITKRYTDKALDFIDDNADRPFFLYMPHSMVHVPLFASQDFHGRTKRGLYGDVMAEVDYGVGRIIAKLKELDIEENTLVIFTSDNGPWLIFKDHGGTAGLLKEGKGTTWDGGMRVPGIFYMPGTVTPGVNRDLGSTLDILPTIASITGADLPTDREIDGYDLIPALNGASESPRDHILFYRRSDIYAVRNKEYKAHFVTENSYTPNNNRSEHTDPLLYQINHDPGELYDVATDHPEIIQSLRKIVEDHKATVKPVHYQMDIR